LKCDRHHHRERADVLHERGQRGHREHEQHHLTLHRHELRRDAMHGGLDGARALDGRAHDERARDDDHDVVAEAGKRGLVRYHAHEDAGDQRERRDEVVPQASPREGGHHGAEHGEREELILGHRNGNVCNSYASRSPAYQGRGA
jgi:hypothetical protein